MTTFPSPDAPHLLIAGDSRDLPAIRSMLGKLPVDAYGQVYIEVAADIQVEHLRAPDGVAVHWLARDAMPRWALTLAPRGELIVTALRGWMAEWLDPLGEPAPPVILWIGCSTSPKVSELCVEIDVQLDRRYRLAGDSTRTHPHEGEHA